MAAVGLHALEALGRVVQDGGGGHDAEGAVGLDLGRAPARGGGPGAGEHVVGGDFLRPDFGAVGGGDGTWVEAAGYGEF